MKAYLRTNKTNPIEVTKSVSSIGDCHYTDISNGKKYYIEELYIPSKGTLTLLNADIIPVNIAHFHGRSLGVYKELQSKILECADLSNKPDIDIITCYTDEDKCLIKKQCDKWGYKLVNAAEGVSSAEWSMPNKIRYYIDALKASDKEIVMLMDGYDTLLITFEDLLRKFKKSGMRILFNATRNNYPNVDIDYVPYRRLRGLAKYFNAGCCIGYREDLIKFYEEAQEFLELENPYNSEQFVIRHAFAKYSGNYENTFVDFDYRNDIFQLFCKTGLIEESENRYIIL